MNKILYNTAMDKITMSDECEKKIIDAVENAAYEKKRRKSFRFIPVIAAAAVLVTGTIGVAAENGGFDWIRGFFSKDDFVMSDDVTELIANIDNFSCESPCGIELSPVGMIADEHTLYCKLNADSLPEGINADDLCLSNIYTNNVPSIDKIIEQGDTEKYGFQSDSLISAGWSMLSEDNAIILKFTADYNAINDGDNVNMRLAFNPARKNDKEISETDIYADISFKIKFGDVKTLEITFEKYKANDTPEKKFFIDKMLVNPLRISTYGPRLFYNGIVLNNDLKVLMKDDTVVTAVHQGNGMSYDPDNVADTQEVISEWAFESPVNPDNIASIYIKDLCLYKCN